MDSILYSILQLLIVITLAPFVNGVIKKIKAFSQKRKGPPVLQQYYDLYKLLKKDLVISETVSWIFKATPYISMAAVLTAFLFVPVMIEFPPFHFMGDIILVIYLLALGRFFMVLAGMDTGSTFGGMGSSREMMIATLVEPSLLVSVFTIGLLSGSTSIYGMMAHSAESGVDILQPVYLLIFIALFFITLFETARIPVDDPATHLELTMVHEAMILEYSGRHLALMELGASLKQLLFITLLVQLFIPIPISLSAVNPLINILISLLLYVFKVIVVAVMLAITEINTVKLRLFTVPNLAALSFILALLGFFQYWVLGR